MCFGSKKEENYDPAPRPAQRPTSSQSQGDVKKSKYNPQNDPNQFNGGSSYAAPPGPPPDRKQAADFAPPLGPPPGQYSSQNYDAPPGPPPGQYAPPPGPPPKHDWEIAVPDTSLFPPPPAIFSGYDRSPTSNATEDEANAGEDWCRSYPMTGPIYLDQIGKTALQAGNIRLMEPVGFNGKLTWMEPGYWQAWTQKNSPDRCIIGYPPLYSVTEHDPLRLGQPRTIYYEVKLARDSPEVFLALGFTALPYPSFRMPGWHRGSLAVHGDDGHKYVNDRWGGRDFTQPFQRGETYGIGMTFRPVGEMKAQVDIFFTRNGTLTGGWALHEETDAEQDLPVTGLEGFHDLSCAIGTYDGVKFEAMFEPSKWMYNPYQL
ncbi:hypothetical protein F66182_10276 [Fusarium sp. NRRL 66182]|nr:hypothetical protein F66182_10276 [Fusarium sp. NRRL 66182]